MREKLNLSLYLVTDRTNVKDEEDFLTKIEDSLKGGIAISDILIIPINVAHKSAYHGPKNTAHTILTKCCVGQNPTTLKIGDITTPIATNIESIIILIKVEFFLVIKHPSFTTLYITINQYFFTIKKYSKLLPKIIHYIFCCFFVHSINFAKLLYTGFF